MKAVFEHLHQELLADLKRSWQLELPEAERVECCYRVAMDYWLKVKEIYLTRVKYDEEFEINFFRELKPLFTSHIEYYLILNQALLFIPGEAEKVVIYWEAEARRYQRFCDKHNVFIRYYEGYRTEDDKAYFLRRNNRQETPPQERLYEDEDCRSSHDHLVRGLLANSLYHEYVNKKLEALKQQLTFPSGQEQHGSLKRKKKLGKGKVSDN